jgi:hypothetical protein
MNDYLLIVKDNNRLRVQVCWRYSKPAKHDNWKSPAAPSTRGHGGRLETPPFTSVHEAGCGENESIPFVHCVQEEGNRCESVTRILRHTGPLSRSQSLLPPGLALSLTPL